MKQTSGFSENCFIFLRYTGSVMKNYAYKLRQRLSFYQEYILFKTMKSAGDFNSNMFYYFSLKSSINVLLNNI